jgi:hypothetical protein
VLVAALPVLAVLETVLRPDLTQRAGSLALIAALVPLLLVRRSRPLLAVACAFGITAVASLVFRGEPDLDVLVF